MTHPAAFALDCILALGANTVVIAAYSNPASADIVAVCGASLATVIAVLDARKKDATLGNTVSVLLGSSFVGSIAPGAVFYNVWPEMSARFTWHVWAALGFVAGLVGWQTVRGFQRVLKRRQDGIIEGVLDRFGCARAKRAEPPSDTPKPDGSE